MKFIKSRWIEQGTKRTGYTEIEATFHAHVEDSFYGKDRKTLKAAINDAKKHWEKTDEDVEIFTNYTMTDYYDDDRSISHQYKHCVELVGYYYLDQFVDMCNVTWEGCR